MAIKGIIFDLDGTIVNSEYIQFLVFKNWLEKYNKNLEWEYWRYQCFGNTGSAILKQLAGKFSIPLDDPQESLVDGLHSYINLIESGQLKVFSGFNGFLDWVQTTELSFIIASNSEPLFIEATLKAVNLWEKIDFISNADVELPKPDPEIYLLAAKRLNLIPEESLVFEDFPACIDAVKEIGSLAVAVMGGRGFDNSFFARADLIIEDYSDQRLIPFIEADANKKQN